MVPYIRKSFFKHYMDGLDFVWEVKDAREPERNFLRANINPMETSIEDEVYKTAGQPHPYDCVEKVYNYALKMTQREVHQAVEGLYHNLNTLQSRSGNQLPFTSINYGTCTLPEGRMFTKALLDVSIEGLGTLYKTSIFPCGIFQYMKGVNDKPGTPNYDLYQLALKSTAKRLYPNYANIDWSGNAGYDVNDPKTYFSTMGCRTANGIDINAEPGTNS
jgi:ribonucleoside-triphosphate reductase